MSMDDETRTLGRQLVWLMRALARLAMPAELQAGYLRRLGLDCLDELALDLDQVIELIPAFVERGWISPREAQEIIAIDEALDAASGTQNAQLWWLEALTLPVWNDVRARATELIESDRGTDAPAEST